MGMSKKLAEDFLASHPRKLSYKLVYKVDPSLKEIYADFNEEEVQLIRSAYEKDLAESGPIDEEYLYEVRSDILSGLDISWIDHIPDEDWHYAEGNPEICNVDLEDQKKFCMFLVLFYQNENSKPESCNYSLELDDEEYKQLIAYRLFDKNLSFYDLKHLCPQLFERLYIDGCPHQHHVMFMSEIEDCVKEIEKTPGFEALPNIPDGPFIFPMVNYIFSHQEEFQDKDLLAAYNLAITD